MKIKILIFILFILSLVGFGVGYFFSEMYICGYTSSCYHFINDIAHPFLYGMGALSFVFFVLLFVPKAFATWLKFAIWFVPLTVILFITWYKLPPNTGLALGPSLETFVEWMSILYIIVSLLLINRTWFIDRERSKKEALNA